MSSESHALDLADPDFWWHDETPQALQRAPQFQGSGNRLSICPEPPSWGCRTILGPVARSLSRIIIIISDLSSRSGSWARSSKLLGLLTSFPRRHPAPYCSPWLQEGGKKIFFLANTATAPFDCTMASESTNMLGSLQPDPCLPPIRFRQYRKLLDEPPQFMGVALGNVKGLHVLGAVRCSDPISAPR